MYLCRQEQANLSSNVRILHAISNGPNVDVYASGNLIATNIPFGEVSDYKILNYGEYELQIYKAGTYDSPLYTEQIYIYPKTFNTLSIISSDNSPSILQLKDSTSVSEGSTYTFLRFLNLSPTAPLLSLSLSNNDVLFDSVEYQETTGYYPLSPGIYDLKVQLDPAQGIYKLISDLTLSPGKFYSIYIVGVFNGNPELGYVFIQDGL